MNQGVKTILYPVTDITKARALFTKLLGVEPIMDQPYYVGYKVGDQDIGLDPNGAKQGLTAATGFYHVDDIKATQAAMIAAGATVAQEPRDVGGGKLVGIFKDVDGNPIGLIQMP